MTPNVIMPGATLEPGRTYVLLTKGTAAALTAGDSDGGWTGTPISFGSHPGWTMAAIRTTDPIPASRIYMRALEQGAPRDGVGIFYADVDEQTWETYLQGEEWKTKIAETANDVGEGLTGAVSGVATLLKWAPWLAVGTIILGLAIVLVVTVKS